jgi:hypothetical protein
MDGVTGASWLHNQGRAHANRSRALCPENQRILVNQKGRLSRAGYAFGDKGDPGTQPNRSIQLESSLHIDEKGNEK